MWSSTGKLPWRTESVAEFARVRAEARSLATSARLGRELIGLAVLVPQVLVRRRIIGELLLLAVPFQVLFQPVGDVADDGGRGVAVADFDVAVAGLPAAHAIEEIAGV